MAQFVNKSNQSIRQSINQSGNYNARITSDFKVNVIKKVSLSIVWQEHKKSGKIHMNYTPL